MIILTKEQYSKLVRGQFTVHSCPNCDSKGWYWVHEDGTKRNPDATESHDDFYKHECNFDENDCDGHGFRVVYNP